LPLTDLLGLVAKKGVNRSHVVIGAHKEFTSWQVHADNIDLTAAFVKGLNSSHLLTPFSMRVVHNGNKPDLKDLGCHHVIPYNLVT
jgi:hypothetical protein